MNCAPNAKYNNPEWIGKKINSLTVLSAVNVKNSCGKQWYWMCKCDCGNVKLMKACYVTSGHSKTCGCGKTYRGAVKHKEIHERLYTIWSHMIQRCECDTEASKKRDSYKRYCGRGIKVCDEWHNYTTFAKWARDNGYEDDLSIERIDNDGNYCPENCKWIKRSLQARNRGTTLWVEYQGKKMSLAEACEITHTSYKRAFQRIKYMNWPVEEALSIQVDETRKWKRSDRFCNKA